MKVGAGRSQLYDAQKTARARHEAATADWDDATRRRFEDAVWLPADALVNDVLRAIDELTVLFSEVRSDCQYTPDY